MQALGGFWDQRAAEVCARLPYISVHYYRGTDVQQWVNMDLANNVECFAKIRNQHFSPKAFEGSSGDTNPQTVWARLAELVDEQPRPGVASKDGGIDYCDRVDRSQDLSKYLTCEGALQR